MEGVDKEKRRSEHDIYRNYIFNDRYSNMYKSFIKIKIKGDDTMIEIVYRTKEGEFKEDDLIQVIRVDPFTGEKIEVVGRVIKSLLNNEIKLDTSTRYHSSTIDININEIVKINKI